ncbi:MAG: ABC transporter ATP-binding protein [Pseudomonadota bacterium]
MTKLTLSGVNKFYGENHVLRDVTLTVEAGEFVVIVGPSGCGKTTLLRVVAGLERIDSGTIEMDGVLINDVPPASRDVAMVFQSYALYPHMTIHDNLSFGLQIAGFSEAEITERVADVLRILSLEAYGDRKPAELSGGQRQRVALGRALVRQPQIFLFDEPLSNLDAALRMATRIEIANIHRTSGSSIIYVTHDQTEAMTLAGRIVVMRDGLIEQVGPPMELYNDPANRFVARFLGSPAMNFIDARFFGIHDADVIGLRPQHLELAEHGRIAGKVVHFERLGSDTHLIADIGDGKTVVARLGGQQEFALNQRIALDYDDANALRFDAEGRRIHSTESTVA